jgi:hypothetical protein
MPALIPLANLTVSGSSTSTVTFSSISGSYRDLRLVIMGGIASGSAAFWRINGDTGSNYSFVIAEGDGGGSTSSGGGTASLNYFNSAFSIWTYGGNPLTVITLDLLDYSATDKHKSSLMRANSSTQQTNMRAGRWANTASITSLTFSVSGDNWVAGSSFALYGVSA